MKIITASKIASAPLNSSGLMWLEKAESGQVTIEDIGDPQTLLQWSQDDPVDAWEMQRNDRTEAAQGNRNPYIDNPDWIADAFLLNSSASITVTIPIIQG